MLVAMVCYFGVCIALLFDLRGSFKEPAPRQPMIRRLESARSMNTGKSSMHTLQAWMQSKSEPSPVLRATGDSASKSPRPRPAAKPQRAEARRPFVSSSARFYAEIVSRQQAALLRAGSQHQSLRADAKRGALSGHVSSARPFVSSSARFYAEVVSRQQAALLRAGSEQRATLAKELPKQINTTFR